MKSLSDLQREFQQYLFDGDDNIVHQVAPHDSAKDRLVIYRNAYLSRIIEVLMKDFPALYNLLGHEQFHNMAIQYISHFPSSFRSIRWIATHLPKFLAENEPFKHQPILNELATFEWFLAEAFDAQDSNIFSVEELSLITSSAWPMMKIKLIPALFHYTQHWNAIDFWQAIQQETKMRVPEKPPSLSRHLIWRNHLQVHYRLVSEVEAVLLTDIMIGKDFAALCERLCEFYSQEEVALTAVKLLKQWMCEGLIETIYFEDQNKKGAV